MVDAKQLKKFASDICVLLPAAVETLNRACDSLQKTASANKSLAERASKAEAAKVSFDSNKLYKAASAVSKLFDSELSPEQLYSVYNTTPTA